MAHYESKVCYLSFAILSILICLLGIILNGLTLLTFLRHRSLLTVSNIILFSMCISDFITSSIATPFLIHANLVEKWPFGESGCKLYAFLTTLCGLASINHLAGIAFERYNAMEREPAGRGLINDNRKIVVYFACFLWLYSLIFSVAPLAKWSSYTLEGIGTSCSVDWSSPSPTDISYIVALYVLCFVLPLVIILFSYHRVYRVVQHMRVNANNIWGNLSTAAAEALKTEKKMATLFLLMIIAFLVAWTPYAVVSLVAASGHKDELGPLGESIPSYFAKTSCIYNPVIYVLFFKRFRQKLFTFLPFCSRCLARGNQVGQEPPISVHTEEENIQPKNAKEETMENIPKTGVKGGVAEKAQRFDLGVKTKSLHVTELESLELISLE